ncbi:hypothetical protein LEP1GSC161_3336 [Leptospira santarosai str. CBC1416]|uniref:Uncharacterized protein n=1 Tax=Leptospira santarosai str. CBC1416 TaxID=1193059 RepID=M6WDF6_9LEPT|nr:hypothetical protein LEP1GSC040_1249 [Leptospira santarosai str. 2000030832]EMO59813.1 hypothetical protein LEP1GSC161_3336 [Leptospira santarosai str. CBC1416]
MNSKNRNGFKVKEKIRIIFFVFGNSILPAKGLYFFRAIRQIPKKLAAVPKFFELGVYTSNFFGTRIPDSNMSFFEIDFRRLRRL